MHAARVASTGCEHNNTLRHLPQSFGSYSSSSQNFFTFWERQTAPSRRAARESSAPQQNPPRTLFLQAHPQASSGVVLTIRWSHRLPSSSRRHSAADSAKSVAAILELLTFLEDKYSAVSGLIPPRGHSTYLGVLRYLNVWVVGVQLPIHGARNSVLQI